MRGRIGMAALAALALGGGALAAGGAQAAGRDAKLWGAVQEAELGALTLLEQMVNIDSQTGDLEGAAKLHAILKPRFEALGATVAMSPAEAEGVAPNMVATWTGKGQAKILIIAHVDTVFPRGTVARWSYHTDDKRAYGPGVGDEKGGVVEALTALEILKAQGFDRFGQITFLVDGSEETGSPGSTELIRKLAREHDVELNMEPGDPPDGVTVWRKGSANYTIEVHGRPAHSGVAPQLGRNAAVELIHQIESLKGVPTSGEQETANLTVMRAGERTNIIPDLATATINVRVRKAEDYDRILKMMQANAATTVVPDTTVTVTRQGNFPPLSDNAGTLGLADRAKAIYAELGRTLNYGGNGGASESALASAEGAAALDGLGPVGGDFHTDKEWIELATFAPRIYLTARMIAEISARPPKRAAH